MKRVIYFYNLSTKELDHSEVLMDDMAPVPTTGTNASGEALGVTLIKPADGLYTPIKIDLVKQAWFGATREDWLAGLPDPAPTTPTADQQNQAALMLQVAQTKTDQANFDAQIMLQVASLKSNTATAPATDASTTTTPTNTTTDTTAAPVE
ncbi:hypothetical protein [Lactiplantibacillus brownii]|uniref:hypothetical protein n=1 Tax=Lactiplantibacillus brownii TaxID=3069269 RepID=UPI0038B305DF